MTIYEKLAKIQSTLKAPKGQYNAFGKYKYRNCEDILEAVKPLLAEVKAVVIIVVVAIQAPVVKNYMAARRARKLSETKKEVAER